MTLAEITRLLGSLSIVDIRAATPKEWADFVVMAYGIIAEVQREDTALQVRTALEKARQLPPIQ